MRRKKFLVALLILFFVALVFFTWVAYCSIYEREAYLTREMMNSVALSPTDSINHIREFSFIISLFAQVFFLLPANCSNVYNLFFPVNGLMLSPACYIVGFLFLFWLLKRAQCIHNREFILISGFCLFINVVFYSILLWSYLFVFYPEFTTESFSHMQNMTSHYAEPALVGPFMILLFILLSDKQHEMIVISGFRETCKGRTIACALVAILVSYPSTLLMLFDNAIGIDAHEVTEQKRSEGVERVSPLIANLSKVEDSLNSRVLVVDDALKENGYCFLHYAVSPISTVDVMEYQDAQSLKELASQTNCNYIYIGQDYADKLDSLRSCFGEDLQIQQPYKIS